MPRDVFVHPTVASLVAGVSGVAQQLAEQGPVSGVVVLTPIQRWWLDTSLCPDRFDQSVGMELVEDVDPVALRAALEALVEHHDALRMRIEHSDGRWRQDNAPVGPVDVLALCDVSAEAEQDAAMADVIEQVHAGFDLGRGPLLKAVLFELGAGRAPVLLVAVHHLVVDGVSWRILLEDLQTAYAQAARGQVVRLEAKTTSFQEWSRRLSEHTAEGGFDAELDYWAGVGRGCDPVLPVDAAGPNTIASTRVLTVALASEQTRALLHEVPGVYRTQINDVLLAALGRVLSGWTGRERVLVDLEGHGREDLLDGVDLSRTVGWFTTMFPVAVEFPTPAGEDLDWGVALKSVKEQLRAVPGRGLGYGALRYFTDRGSELGAVGPPISFNYLGQFDWLTGEQGGPIRGMWRGLDADLSPDETRTHLVDVVGRIEDGCLRFDWAYSANLHQHDTVRRLAEQMITALQEIIAHCAAPGAGGRTPSDFPLAALDQAGVDRLIGDGRDIEDLYPLSPMQAGMVFHGLVDTTSGAYFNQVQLRLSGVGDPQAWALAWQQVADRTPVLRSSPAPAAGPPRRHAADHPVGLA
jgi:non-ribosomal peptide synthase protein (TIGR01720 family)